MRILLGISIVVLVAILWSAISIVRHILLGRRRNALVRRRQMVEQAHAMSSLRYAAVAPLPARFAAPVGSAQDIFAQVTRPSPVTVAPLVHQAAPIPVFEPVAEPVLMALRETLQPEARHVEAPTIQVPERDVVTVRPPEMMPFPPMRDEMPETPFPVVESASYEPQLRILEVPGDIALRDIYPSRPIFPSLVARQDSERPSPPPAIHPAPPAEPNSRRPVRSVHQQPDGSRPSYRPDWIYFNKDMGDLSDPAPSRVRVRTR